jgi:hypothetical protein
VEKINQDKQDNKPEIKVTLNQSGVIAPGLQAIKDCSQSVLFGLKSSDQITKLPESFSEEEKYLKQQFGEPDSFSIQKQKYKNWLISKGFEELINGLAITLVEAYRYVSIYEMFQGTTEKIETTMEEINKKFDDLREQSARQSLPALFDKIRPLLTAPLSYESHIKTLNKARSCLVHRKGKISPEDMNTQSTLLIRWFRYYLFFDYKDGEVEVVPGHVTKESVSIKMRLKEEVKEFKYGETITFSFKELQELMTTCHLFLIDLASKLPIIKQK